MAISVRGLRKSYGETDAVAGLDLEVRTGEVFALLGPNGAGKTTTVEILEGFRRRGTGEFDELTVTEVVSHFAAYYPAPDDPAAVIARVGLTGKARSRTHALSGGQKRRLDVALGIIGRPELMFLDEPTTGFDPEARREFWELIRDLAAAGTTILLTTHYLYEAEALADRVGVITAGRLVAVAPPAELGDRQSAPATVSWRSADGSAQSEQTLTPTALVMDLAKQFDGSEVPGLVVTRPTLEDVYLRMIGASA
jgi:ABC-2 type transport system ATP-binding protein